jgi:hypothetical protein
MWHETWLLPILFSVVTSYDIIQALSLACPSCSTSEPLFWGNLAPWSSECWLSSLLTLDLYWLCSHLLPTSLQSWVCLHSPRLTGKGLGKSLSPLSWVTLLWPAVTHDCLGWWCWALSLLASAVPLSNTDGSSVCGEKPKFGCTFTHLRRPCCLLFLRFPTAFYSEDSSATGQGISPRLKSQLPSLVSLPLKRNCHDSCPWYKQDCKGQFDDLQI